MLPLWRWYRVKDYENNKERLQEQAQNKYRELSNEEKDIERKFGRNQYSNMSEEYLTV